MLKWILAIGILVAATIASGGLDLVAITVAMSVWLFFRSVTK